MAVAQLGFNTDGEVKIHSILEDDGGPVAMAESMGAQLAGMVEGTLGMLSGEVVRAHTYSFTAGFDEDDGYVASWNQKDPDFESLILVGDETDPDRHYTRDGTGEKFIITTADPADTTAIFPDDLTVAGNDPAFEIKKQFEDELPGDGGLTEFNWRRSIVQARSTADDTYALPVVEEIVLDFLRAVAVEGGNPFIQKLLDGPKIEDLGELAVKVSAAQLFENYLLNQSEIDGLLSAGPTSVLTDGYYIDRTLPDLPEGGSTSPPFMPAWLVAGDMRGHACRSGVNI